MLTLLADYRHWLPPQYSVFLLHNVQLKLHIFMYLPQTTLHLCQNFILHPLAYYTYNRFRYILDHDHDYHKPWAQHLQESHASLIILFICRVAQFLWLAASIYNVVNPLSVWSCYFHL